jgi:hypothetical protein
LGKPSAESEGAGGGAAYLYIAFILLPVICPILLAETSIWQFVVRQQRPDAVSILELFAFYGIQIAVIRKASELLQPPVYGLILSCLVALAYANGPTLVANAHIAFFRDAAYRTGCSPLWSYASEAWAQDWICAGGMLGYLLGFMVLGRNQRDRWPGGWPTVTIALVIGIIEALLLGRFGMASSEEVHRVLCLRQ